MMESAKEGTIYAIGHSLLERYGIDTVADVKSVAYNRHHRFNRKNLTGSLRADGVSYVFLSRELGARPEDPGCY